MLTLTHRHWDAHTGTHSNWGIDVKTHKNARTHRHTATCLQWNKLVTGTHIPGYIETRVKKKWDTQNLRNTDTRTLEYTDIGTFRH